MRTIWAVTMALAVAGCTAEGERADSGDCPDGETCSDQTPNGLFFVGSALGDQPLGRMAPLAVAVGGTQSIKALTAAGAGSPAFALPFTAATSNEKLGVSGTAPPEVTVQGLAEGTAYLRLLEPGTNNLFDRLEVTVKAVSTTDLKPKTYLNPAADSEYAATPGKWQLFYPLPPGSSEPCVARIFGADGKRLADESLSMSVVGAELAAGARESWDTLGLSSTGSGTTTGQVVVRTSDGMSRPSMIGIVTVADDIKSVAAAGGQLTSASATAGRPTTFCFRTTKGTDLVAGATFQFTGGTGLNAAVSTVSKNCAVVTASAPTSATLTVKAGGIMRDFQISFLASKPGAQDPEGSSDDPAGSRGAPGERAVSRK